MRWGMAPAGGVRLRRADQRNVAARQVNRRGRCQWQPGRVQRPPPLYLFRGYGSRPNDWRRGWWRLACLHTESDVRTPFLRCLPGTPIRSIAPEAVAFAKAFTYVATSIYLVEGRGVLSRDQIKAGLRAESVTDIEEHAAKPLSTTVRNDEQFRDECGYVLVGQGSQETNHTLPLCDDKRWPRMLPRSQSLRWSVLWCRPSLGT